VHESVLENPMRKTNLRERERERGGGSLWVDGKITCNVVDLFNVAKDRRMAGRWFNLRFVTKRGFSLPSPPTLLPIPPYPSASPPHFFHFHLLRLLYADSWFLVLVPGC